MFSASQCENCLTRMIRRSKNDTVDIGGTRDTHLENDLEFNFSKFHETKTTTKFHENQLRS